MTLKELSQALNKTGRIVVSPDGLAKYERAIRTPNRKKVELIASYFGVSSDYLAGYGYSRRDIINFLVKGYKNNYSDYFGGSLTHPKLSKHREMRKAVNIFIKNDFTNNFYTDLYNQDISWWLKKFEFIYNYAPIYTLLNTHDEYTESQIQLLLLDAIERNKNIPIRSKHD